MCQTVSYFCLTKSKASLLPKDYFQFKQFGIHQKGSTLKVCTDSCLFGAWAAFNLSDTNSILDIGTGTGLLALMMAQQHPQASITALEIDAKSAEVARHNVSLSPWKNNIKVAWTPVQEYTSSLFDTIISNPPFFSNQLVSGQPAHNLAKHDTGLTKEELIESLILLLSKKGVIYLLFPEREGRAFAEIADKRELYLNEEVIVRNKKDGPVFRLIQKYSFSAIEKRTSEITIYEADQVYTSDFVNLLKDYYLYL